MRSNQQTRTSRLLRATVISWSVLLILVLMKFSFTPSLAVTARIPLHGYAPVYSTVVVDGLHRYTTTAHSHKQLRLMSAPPWQYEQKCLSVLLAAKRDGNGCLGLLPPVQDYHGRRQQPWQSNDYRIDVTTSNMISSRNMRLINPSVLCYGGQLLLSARAMRAVAVQPPCTDIWHSHIIVTSIAFHARNGTLGISPNFWIDDTSRRIACSIDLTRTVANLPGTLALHPPGRERTDENTSNVPVVADNDEARRCANLGIFSSVGLGQEDPRWFEQVGATTALGAGLYLTSNSPKSISTASTSNLHITTNKKYQMNRTCSPLLQYRSMVIQSLRPLSSLLPLRWQKLHDPNDRNWLLFSQDGYTYAIFSIEPHVVLQVASDGSCEEAYRTSNRIFSRRFPGRDVHGGANPIIVTSSVGKPLFHLGILHTKDATMQYANFAYIFSAVPPFRILSISRKPLKLRGKRIRFASSLTYLGSRQGTGEQVVGISYGSDDVEARLMAVPLRLLLLDMLDVTGLAVNIDLFDDHGGPADASRVQADGLLKQPAPSDAQEWLSNPRGSVSGAGTCFLQQDLRYDAPSIRMVPSSEPNSCCDLCSQTKHCAAFSWAPTDGGVCWLKQWAGTALQRRGFVSGHFGRASLCACRRLNGSRLVYNSTTAIRVLTLRSDEACCSACMQHRSCGAWTWSSPRNANAVGYCELHTLPTDMRGSRQSILVYPMSGYTSSFIELTRSVLFVHHHLPQRRFGSDRRLVALLRQVQDLGWRVSYAAVDNVDRRLAYGHVNLEYMGIPILSPIRTSEAVATFALAQHASVIVLCLWFWGVDSVPARYLRALRTRLPRAKLVIMSDDVHFKRLELAAQYDHRYSRQVVDRVRDEEFKWYFYADHIFLISQQDKRTILSALPPERAMHETRFSTIRYTYADRVLFAMENRSAFHDRYGLTFVGNLNNPSNMHGLRWFMVNVWPMLRKQESTLTLHVVGDVSADGVMKSDLPSLLRNASGVVVTGYIADEELAVLLQQVRVLIVPIRWATGILTKQTLAHVHGLPTVVTHTGAQHVAPAPLDGHGYAKVWSHTSGRYVPVRIAAVAETHIDFAANVLRVHRNETLWMELSSGAARFARSGGDGQGVCPSGAANDWLAFWSKLELSACGSLTR